jgi:hypothetical protein
MKQEANIHVSGNSGSSINIHSSGATATTTTNYNEPTIFNEMIEAIKSKSFDSATESSLIDNVQALAVSHQSGCLKKHIRISLIIYLHTSQYLLHFLLAYPLYYK